MHLSPADAPTLYFVGVTTGQSSIMTIFPEWASRLGLDNARVVGIDIPLNAEPWVYRDVVSFIKSDPLSAGALVTTHKIDVLRSADDLFDELDRYAGLLGEVSCISKRDGRLVGRAVDAFTGLIALESFLPRRHWKDRAAEALFLGAGGATVAITTSLLTLPDEERPVLITVTDVDPERLEHIEEVHYRLDHRAGIQYVLIEHESETDNLVSTLPPHSLVANGTGMGKDRPGSPVSDAAVFPDHGYAWDYNYRGEFTFLKQAVRSRPNVTAVDGWVYFVLGWTQVIAEVFRVAIPTSGALFDELAAIADGKRRE